MLIWRITFILILIFPSIAFSQKEVSVGLTSIQPPLVIDDEKRNGLIYDVFDLLNNSQNQFNFVTQLFPPKRLLANYNEIDTHIIAYNNVNWGWHKRGGKASVNLTNGRDLFFRLKENTKHNYKSSIAAVRGFHYAFADFDADKLSTMSNVSLVKDEESVLRLVQFKRVGRGIAGETFLNWISATKPDLFEKLYIYSDQPDHTYHRQLIVFDSSPINVSALNKLLKKVYETGQLQQIYNKYGLVLPELEGIY